MLAGIMAVFNAIAGVVAKIISFIPWWLWVCLGLILFGGWLFHGGSCRDFCCRRTPSPRPEKWDQLKVSKATTGATLECTTGRRDRRTRTVSLSHIAAPSNELAEQSRASLERLAGSFIRVRHQGLFRPALDNEGKPVSAKPGEAKEIKCPECGGSGKVPNICEVDCFFCPTDTFCSECHGTKKLQLSYDIADRCQELIAAHTGEDGCKDCLKDNKPCQELQKALFKIILANSKEPKNIECPICGGTGKYTDQPLEARGQIVGTIYSAYGQCLNTEQVRLGMAKLLADAPKEWKVFEDEAKKKNLGIWRVEPKKKGK